MPKPGPATNLATWIANAPKGSARLVVAERKADGQVICSYNAPELAEHTSAIEAANTIIETSAQWAESEGHECPFVAQFSSEAGDILATYKWRIGSVDGSPFRWPIDGSPEGIMAQLQTHLQSTNKLHYEQLRLLIDGYKELIELQNRRIGQLEKRHVQVEKREADIREIESYSVVENFEEQKFLQLLGVFRDIVGRLGPGASPDGAAEAAAAAAAAATTGAASVGGERGGNGGGNNTGGE